MARKASKADQVLVAPRDVARAMVAGGLSQEAADEVLGSLPPGKAEEVRRLVEEELARRPTLPTTDAGA